MVGSGHQTYPFELELNIEGTLADGEVASPTHALTSTRSEQGLCLRLAREATLDRDFILQVRAPMASAESGEPASAGAQSHACAVPSGTKTAGHVVLASLRLPPDDAKTRSPLHLKVVIDCSGSMAGVSIHQARKAALEILDQLRPGDWFNFSFYGDEVEHLWPGSRQATPAHLAQAVERLHRLDADLGGTQTALALREAYGMGYAQSTLGRIKKKLHTTLSPAGAEAEQADLPLAPQLLLITDGQTWDEGRVVDEAMASNHRVFTVGVGMAAVEGLFARLADATGGAYEIVAPQEGMAECVLNQFHRLRQPRVRLDDIRFEQTPRWRTDLPKTAFAGDTVHVYAGFDEETVGSVRLNLHNGDGSSTTVTAQIHAGGWSELPRLAAAARIAAATSPKGVLKLALEYRLLTPQTNYLVVADRADKADDLPELAKVPHMLPAGWGGTSVAHCVAAVPYQGRRPMSVSSMKCEEAMPLAFLRSSSENLHIVDTQANSGDLLGCVMYSRRSNSVSENQEVGIDKYDIPAFLRRQSDDAPEHARAQPEPTDPVQRAVVAKPEAVRTESGPMPYEFVSRLQSSTAGLLKASMLPTRIEELVGFGLPTHMVDALRSVVDCHGSERDVVFAFLMTLMSARAMEKSFIRAMTRLIRAGWQRTRQDRTLLKRMAAHMAALTRESWNWVEYQETAMAGA